MFYNFIITSKMGNEEGTTFTGSKSNIVIDIAYCGGCGWSLIAKQLCDSVKKKLPSAMIDCRP